MVPLAGVLLCSCVSLCAASSLDGLFLTEILFQPKKGPEFIEFWNGGTVPIELSGQQFTNGVDYTFPANTQLQPNEVVVVTGDVADFRDKYGSNIRVLGPWKGGVSSDGEKLEVSNGPRIRYYNGEKGWPLVVEGHSIFPLDLNQPYDVGGNWQVERPTPGQVHYDPRQVAISEIMQNLDNRSNSSYQFVELYNPQIGSVSLTGMSLKIDTVSAFTFPPDLSIQPGATLVVARTSAGFQEYYVGLYEHAVENWVVLGNWSSDAPHKFSSVTLLRGEQQLKQAQVLVPAVVEGYSQVTKDQSAWEQSALLGGSPGIYTHNDSVCDLTPRIPENFEPSDLVLVGNSLFCVSDNSQLAEFDVNTMTLKRLYLVASGPGSPANQFDLEGCTFGDGTFFLGVEFEPISKSAQILVFDLASGRIIHTLTLPSYFSVSQDDGLEGLVLVPSSNGGYYFYVGNQHNGMVYIWNYTTMSAASELVDKFPAVGNDVAALAYNNGQLFVSVPKNNQRMVLFDVSDPTNPKPTSQTFKMPYKDVEGIAVAPLSGRGVSTKYAAMWFASDDGRTIEKLLWDGEKFSSAPCHLFLTDPAIWRAQTIAPATIASNVTKKSAEGEMQADQAYGEKGAFNSAHVPTASLLCVCLIMSRIFS